MKQKVFLFASIITMLSLTGCINNGKETAQLSVTPTQEQATEEAIEVSTDTHEEAKTATEVREQPLDEHAQAVADLKKLLSKTEGMKFGSSEFYAYSAKYIESENVFEHKYKQSFLPKEDADPELLNDIKTVGIESEKKFITGNSTLIRLMTPLKPTIRCIVYYSDNTECLRFSIPYSDIYLNN